MIHLDPFLNRLVLLAEQAGVLIKRIYDQDHPADIVINYKEDGSPFTRADREADLLIQKGLYRLAPHIPLVSEEQTPPVLKNPEGPFWMVDPLDGTKGFIQRSGEFVVNIALIDKKRPVLGLIHVPLTAETYVAFQNQAYYIKKGQIERLKPLLPPLGEWDVVVGRPLLEEDLSFQEMKKRFPLRTIFEVGSALKFCSFARGEAHFSWRFLPCYEWDTAAAQALIEALGGCFTTLEGAPFLYGKPNYLNAEGFFVYGSKELQYFAPLF